MPSRDELRYALVKLRHGSAALAPELRDIPDPYIDEAMSLIDQQIREARYDELKRRCMATAEDLAKMVNGGEMFSWDWLVKEGYVSPYDLDRLAELSTKPQEGEGV